MASTAASSALLAGFAKYTKVEGRPKAWDIVKLDNEMQEAARKIPTGDGNRMGQVGMVLTAEEYRKRVGQDAPDWKPPRAAGNFPVKKTNELKENYEARVQRWNKRKETSELFELGHNTMIANFFEAFDPQYTKALRKKDAGANMQLTAKECLDHMKAKYGKWGMEEIKDNKARLDEQWDGRGEIDVILDKFEEVKEVAEMAGSSIDMIEMITKLIDAIEPVTEFGPAVREIVMKGIKNWTWEEIKEHLEVSDEARRRKTTAGKGYHAANEASETSKANVAKAVKSGGRARSRSESPTKKGKKGIQVNEDGLVARFTSKHEAVATHCHTHGIMFNRQHNSETCPNPGPGHNKKATIYNQLGGSTECTTPERWRKKRDRGNSGNNDNGEETKNPK
jgi:hypothetical protein